MNALQRILLENPRRIFWSSILNLIVYTVLLALGARWKIIFISGVGAVIGLFGLWGGLRSHRAYGGGKTYTFETTPKEFWQSIIFGFAIYLVFTGFSILLYIQDVMRSDSSGH